MNNKTITIEKWDSYFLRLAKEVASNSKCMSRKIGAVLVKDRAVISTGYNGPPRGAKHCGERLIDFYLNLNDNKEEDIIPRDYDTIWKLCPRQLLNYPSGKGLHLCQAGHAERNALIQAARNGISTLGTIMYAYCALPCKDCTIEIINAGVKRVVCLKGDDYDRYARVLFEECGVEIVQI